MHVSSTSSVENVVDPGSYKYVDVGVTRDADLDAGDCSRALRRSGEVCLTGELRRVGGVGRGSGGEEACFFFGMPQLSSKRRIYTRKTRKKPQRGNVKQKRKKTVTCTSRSKGP